MQHDILDRVIDQWQTEFPELDCQAMAVVGRILRLAGHLERRANAALKSFDLPIWGFDVLGALRRSGRPYSLTPTDLMRCVMLSSGAMTNRIDRLEAQGFVERKPDPKDRRSIHVALTSKGLRTVEKAAVVRFAEADSAIQGLSAKDAQRLTALLRRILLDVESQS